MTDLSKPIEAESKLGSAPVDPSEFCDSYIGRAGGRGRKRGRARQTTGIVWTRTAMQKFDSEVDHG